MLHEMFMSEQNKGKKRLNFSPMNIMKITLWRRQDKEVVSVTINVFVNRARTLPNGCSYSSVHGGIGGQRDKGQKKEL